MKRVWCRHITWRCGIAEDRWEMTVRNWSDAEIYFPIPSSWKVCPICQAERPTKANIQAAELRALMDAGDEE